jgi:hypothetical protein
MMWTAEPVAADELEAGAEPDDVDPAGGVEPPDDELLQAEATVASKASAAADTRGCGTRRL